MESGHSLWLTGSWGHVLPVAILPDSDSACRLYETVAGPNPECKVGPAARDSAQQANFAVDTLQSFASLCPRCPFSKSIRHSFTPSAHRPLPTRWGRRCVTSAMRRRIADVGGIEHPDSRRCSTRLIAPNQANPSRSRTPEQPVSHRTLL
jgi:hypothetical protein